MELVLSAGIVATLLNLMLPEEAQDGVRGTNEIDDASDSVGRLEQSELGKRSPVGRGGDTSGAGNDGIS